MAKKIPDSMELLVYFTRRKFPGSKGGSVIAWAQRLQCPACKKGLMSKPIDEKKGTFKTRAAEYVCPKCGHSEAKREHEEKLTAQILYTCPFCAKEGEADAPFARKPFYGKKAIVFACAGCGERLGVTKKLSMPEPFLAKIEGRAVRKGADKELEEPDEDDDF